jgi:hypothetical protein
VSDAADAQGIDGQILAEVEQLGLLHGRSCGECRLCCKTLEVPELGKPDGKWCPNACSRGCGIHASRPASCRAFDCLWLRGMFEERHRPDRSRLVLSEAKDELGGLKKVEHPETKELLPVFMVFESYRGALSGPGAELADAIKRAGAALAVVEGDEVREMHFPPGPAPSSTANADVRIKV